MQVPGKSKKPSGILKSGSAGQKKTKFSYSESREFAQIESVIEKLESDIAAVTEEMSKSWSNHEKIRDLSEKHKALQEQLDAKMARWVYLNEIAEKIK